MLRGEGGGVTLVRPAGGDDVRALATSGSVTIFFIILEISPVICSEFEAATLGGVLATSVDSTSCSGQSGHNSAKDS